MKVLKNIIVPTGNILIVEGERGKLELVSLGDYGKENNIKADFLGLRREIHGVPHTKMLPLSEKWVITISTQYGCSMGCSMCDVPKIGKGLNATEDDLINQLLAGISLHPEVKHTDRLNVHFARMGEPSFNLDVLYSVKRMKDILTAKNFDFHPVVSTMMPRGNRFLKQFIIEWLFIKNQCLNGEAGLQLSINTTDEIERHYMFGGNALTLTQISKMFHGYGKSHKGRKITLNFALTDKPIDSKLLRKLFNPEFFLCKITPIHLTQSSMLNGLNTSNGYDNYKAYAKVESELKSAGFDVIVFVPSKEEDASRITCGNAILSEEPQ